MKWLKRILAVVASLLVIAVAGLWLVGLRPGHGRNSASVDIDRPAAQVFRYLTDDALVQKWVGGLVEIRHLSPGAQGAGDRLRLAVVLGNERTDMEMTITKFEANRRIDFTIVSVGDASAGFFESGGYQLEEQNGRTHLTLAAQSEYHGFLARLFEPFITPAAQKKLEEDLARLKQLVESEPHGAVPRDRLFSEQKISAKQTE